MRDIKQCTDVFEQLRNVAEGRTKLYCEQHNYTPGRDIQPTMGCSECWKVLLWTCLARTPTSDREDFTAGMELAVAHAQEHIKNGTWDYKPIPLEFEVEKDSNA